MNESLDRGVTNLAGRWYGRARISRTVLGFIRFLVVIVLSIRFAAWLGSTALIYFIPIDGYHIESKMVYLSREFRDGRSIYPDWKKFPYESNFYGPVYFTVVGLASRVLSLDDDGLRNAGRFLTILSVGMLACLVAGLTRRRTGDSRSAVIAAMSLIASAPIVGFGQTVRPDMAAVMFSVAGLFVYSSSESRRWRAVAIGFFTLAIMTKQTAIAPLAALIIWRLSRAEWREVIGLVAGCVASVVTAVSLGAVLWDRRLPIDMLGAGGDPFQCSVGLVNLRRMLQQMPEILLAALAGLWGPMRNAAREPLSYYGLVAAVWGAVSCFKVGADLNYFVDLSVFGAVATGLLWHWSTTLIARGPERPDDSVAVRTSAIARLSQRSLLPMILLWSLYLILTATSPLRNSTANLVRRYREYAMIRGRHSGYRELEDLVALAQSPDSRILTDSPYLAFRSAKQPPFLDPVLFRCSVQTGRVQPTELLRRIDAHEYDLILSTAQLADANYDHYSFGFPPSVAAAIRRSYVFRRGMGGLFVYAPPRQDEPAN